MTSVIIKIKTENAAFIDNPDELPNILREIADKINETPNDFKIYDSNGNNVGTLTRK